MREERICNNKNRMEWFRVSTMIENELKYIEAVAKRRWKDKYIDGWQTKENFINWFMKKYAEQGGKCYYCGLEGNVLSNYRQELKKINMLKYKGFRKGRRGKSFEIDKKEPQGNYNPLNCVLVCYPCNNAKSDVFTHENFKIIGAIIGALQNQENKEKLVKMKNNKFLQGLIYDVIKRKENKSFQLENALKNLRKNSK